MYLIWHKKNWERANAYTHMRNKYTYETVLCDAI